MGRTFNQVRDAWFFDRWIIERALATDTEGDKRVYPISIIPWVGSWVIETIENQAQLSDQADAIRHEWFGYVIYQK